MNNRMFSDNDKQTEESKEPVLVAIINNEVELSITEASPSTKIIGKTLTLEDIDDLSDALLLARAHLVNLSSQDTTPTNEKPCQH